MRGFTVHGIGRKGNCVLEKNMYIFKKELMYLSQEDSVGRRAMSLVSVVNVLSQSL